MCWKVTITLGSQLWQYCQTQNPFGRKHTHTHCSLHIFSRWMNRSERLNIIWVIVLDDFAMRMCRRRYTDAAKLLHRVVSQVTNSICTQLSRTLLLLAIAWYGLYIVLCRRVCTWTGNGAFIVWHFNWISDTHSNDDDDVVELANFLEIVVNVSFSIVWCRM